MDSLFYLAFFGPFAVFGFFAGVVTLRMDLLTPSVRDRSRPDLAVRCFLRSLGSHKWSRAFAVVAPIAQGESCERPAVPGLDVDADRIVVREARDLERYWLPMLASGAGYDRRLSRLKIRKSHRRGPLHFYRAELQVNTFPSWAIFGLLVGILPIFPLLWLTTERYTVTAEIPVVKYKSQWWVASAGLGHDGGTVGVDLPKAKARVA